MCELFGISSKKPTKFGKDFSSFMRRGIKNPDGWGLAYYSGSAVQIIKEPTSSLHSKFAKFIGTYSLLKSDTILVHVRLASRGQISLENTHPFIRFIGKRAYTFIHNGTLKNIRKLQLNNPAPLGKTDSEHAFCYLIKLITKRKIRNWSTSDFHWFHSQLLKINELGKLNCILSDGDLLFCYSDIKGYKNLHYVHSEDGRYLIATRPLTNGKWTKSTAGQLTIFKKGTILYQNQKFKPGLQSLQVISST